jgi:predicted nucleic acid-binding protein
MRILIDTNVLVSAFVFGGKAGTLMNMLFESSHELLVSDYVDAEFKAILEMKWKEKSEKVYSLYHTLPFMFCGSSPIQTGNLRDAKDIPVLSDARFHHIDVILTGDKDFLEADLDSPIILTPSMMMEYFGLS